MTDITLMNIAEAPVQAISKEEIESAVKRMRVVVPNVTKIENLTVVAQESILYRTVPGRDIHYYEDWQGKLQRIPDYKYLKNFATFKEQQLSGDDNASLEDTSRAMTADEKEQHGIPEECIAAICTIVTARERRAFMAEVKGWTEIGFQPAEAVEMAKQTYGELGMSAVGVVDPTEKDKKGNPIKPPVGWSYLQWAKKLAFKNAVNFKYGIPTADEMQALAYRMARKAMPEHWRDVDPTLPREAQAKQADYEAITSEIVEQAKQMTPEELRERREQNVIIMRGKDEGAIGDDYAASDFDRFVDGVLDNIKFFETPAQIKTVLTDLELEYSPETEEMLFDALALYANNTADAEQGKLL